MKNPPFIWTICLLLLFSLFSFPSKPFSPPFLLIPFSFPLLMPCPFLFPPLLSTYSFSPFVFSLPRTPLSSVVTHSSPLWSHFSTAALEVIHFTNLKKPIICLFMTFIILPLTQGYITGARGSQHWHTPACTQAVNNLHTGQAMKRHTALYAHLEVQVTITFTSVSEET